MNEKSLTIKEIVAIEPQIGGVLRQASKVKKADWPDYSSFKQQLMPLVGFYSPNKRLRTSSAYEITIQQLVTALNL